MSIGNWFVGIAKVLRSAYAISGHGKRITALEARLAKVENSAPPKPPDLKVMHGIYWSRAEPGLNREAYCPGCVAEGLYVLMQHRDLGLDSCALDCAKCKSTFVLKNVKAQEAINST